MKDNFQNTDVYCTYSMDWFNKVSKLLCLHKVDGVNTQVGDYSDDLNEQSGAVVAKES